eukprot:MONOS_4386.1-p1 / transcript=MONOS_4386.1 / gene=MONOS_4386 / organism=Monocercomonoides_exilis_PA203 / gene_product=unspecified product / transcript_product=unspecified product / location=Mono_scaffold00116:55521-58898(-) / protein_length=1078 / sequence_SO=supercontig / SO=protein_coding / is_pseudo=false
MRSDPLSASEIFSIFDSLMKCVKRQTTDKNVIQMLCSFIIDCLYANKLFDEHVCVKLLSELTQWIERDGVADIFLDFSTMLNCIADICFERSLLVQIAALHSIEEMLNVCQKLSNNETKLDRSESQIASSNDGQDTNKLSQLQIQQKSNDQLTSSDVPVIYLITEPFSSSTSVSSSSSASSSSSSSSSSYFSNQNISVQMPPLPQSQRPPPFVPTPPINISTPQKNSEIDILTECLTEEKFMKYLINFLFEHLNAAYDEAADEISASSSSSSSPAISGNIQLMNGLQSICVILARLIRWKPTIVDILKESGCCELLLEVLRNHFCCSSNDVLEKRKGKESMELKLEEGEDEDEEEYGNQNKTCNRTTLSSNVLRLFRVCIGVNESIAKMIDYEKEIEAIKEVNMIFDKPKKEVAQKEEKENCNTLSKERRNNVASSKKTKEKRKGDGKKGNSKNSTNKDEKDDDYLSKSVYFVEKENKKKEIGKDIFEQEKAKRDNRIYVSFSLIDALFVSRQQKSIRKAFVEKEGMKLFIRWAGDRQLEFTAAESSFFARVFTVVVQEAKKQNLNNSLRKALLRLFVRGIEAFPVSLYGPALEFVESISISAVDSELAATQSLIKVVSFIAHTQPDAKEKCVNTLCYICSLLYRHMPGEFANNLLRISQNCKEFPFLALNNIKLFETLFELASPKVNTENAKASQSLQVVSLMLPDIQAPQSVINCLTEGDFIERIVGVIERDQSILEKQSISKAMRDYLYSGIEAGKHIIDVVALDGIAFDMWLAENSNFQRFENILGKMTALQLDWPAVSLLLTHKNEPISNAYQTDFLEKKGNNEISKLILYFASLDSALETGGTILLNPKFVDAFSEVLMKHLSPSSPSLLLDSMARCVIGIAICFGPLIPDRLIEAVKNSLFSFLPYCSQLEKTTQLIVSCMCAAVVSNWYPHIRKKQLTLLWSKALIPYRFRNVLWKKSVSVSTDWPSTEIAGRLYTKMLYETEWIRKCPFMMVESLFESDWNYLQLNATLANNAPYYYTNRFPLMKLLEEEGAEDAILALLTHAEFHTRKTASFLLSIYTSFQCTTIAK